MIEDDPDCLEYYNILQRAFNLAFTTANGIGELALNKTQGSRALDWVAAGISFIPIVGAVSLGAKLLGEVVDERNNLREKTNYGHLLNINNGTLSEGETFSKSIALSFTLIRKSEIAHLSKSTSVPYKQMFGSEPVKPVMELALKDSKAALNFIFEGKAGRANGVKDFTKIIDLIIADVKSSSSKSRTANASAGVSPTVSTSTDSSTGQSGSFSGLLRKLGGKSS